MKTIKFIIVAALAMVLSNSISAQAQEKSSSSVTKTESFKVWGNCGMCKARIKKAAAVDGVSKAEWDKETKMLAVTYNPSKTGIDAISKKVNSAGHDTEKGKAEAKDYDALPGCCKYERRK